MLLLCSGSRDNRARACAQINGHNCNGLLLGREVIQTCTIDVNNLHIRSNNKSNTYTSCDACALTRRSGRTGGRAYCAFFLSRQYGNEKCVCSRRRGTVLIGRPRPAASNEVCSGSGSSRGRNGPCYILAVGRRLVLTSLPASSLVFPNPGNSACEKCTR